MTSIVSVLHPKFRKGCYSPLCCYIYHYLHPPTFAPYSNVLTCYKTQAPWRVLVKICVTESKNTFPFIPVVDIHVTVNKSKLLWFTTKMQQWVSLHCCQLQNISFVKWPILYFDWSHISVKPKY